MYTEIYPLCGSYEPEKLYFNISISSVCVVVVIDYVFAREDSLQGFKNQSDLAKNLLFFKIVSVIS